MGLVLIPVVAIGCGGDDDPAAADCDGTGAVSSVDSGHSHSVCVASADLMNPPASGARYVTSSDDGHSHEIELSATQLMEIATGQTVTVTSTAVSGHTHTFSVG